MRARQSVAFGFGSGFALVLVLIGVVASASGQPVTTRTSLAGTVQGGLSAVAGARVALYAAGTAYGANATSLGRATTDASGNFTVKYTPPATPAILYLVARGGSTGAGTNPVIGLMGVAGRSDALPTSVTINELTTVAANWALAQFIDATGHIIGAPASNATGLANAANQAEANLVDIATGASASFWSNNGATAASCSGASPPTNCAGLERLNSLANILAACVASAGPSSSACSGLLSQTGSTTTLRAAHQMATHLVRNVGSLLALQSASPPFTPALVTAPDGWEIALNFVPSGVSLFFPISVAIDAAGNVWVTNDADNSVIELNASGGLAGNFNNTNTVGANFDFPEGVAIDAAGNVWVTNPNGNSVTELTSNGGLAGNFNNTNPSGANFDFPERVAIDAATNVWVTNELGNSVTELTSRGGLAGNFDPGSALNSPFDLAIDAAGDAWVTNFGNSVTELTSTGSLAGNFDPGGVFSSPFDLAIDAAGNVWVTNQFGNSVTELTSSGGLAGNFAPSRANFNSPDGVAIDAAGNVWVPNEFGKSVTELTSNGSLIAYFRPGGDNFNNPFAVAIDASGDVWVTNAPSTEKGSVTELIGAAHPVLTPKVACLTQSPPHAVCLP